MNEIHVDSGALPVLNEASYGSLQRLEREILETVFNASAPGVNGEPAGLRYIIICRLLESEGEDDRLKDAIVNLLKKGLLITDRYNGRIFYQIRDEHEVFLEAKIYGE